MLWPPDSLKPVIREIIMNFCDPRVRSLKNYDLIKHRLRRGKSIEQRIKEAKDAIKT